MSDTVPSSRGSTAIDPKRPWITDPREDVAGMNWMQSLTNPFGETSRLHFTRAWTGLFFFRLIWYVGFSVLAAIFAAAGAENAGNYVPPSWAFLGVIVLTAIASLILHIRRLSDARRSALWAVLVGVPAVIALIGFALGTVGGARAYEQAVDRIEREAAAALQAPVDPADASPQDAESETADPAADGDGARDGESRGGEARRGGERRQRGPEFDPAQISQRAFAFDAGVSMALALWAVPSFLVMLWSLLWVGRLPTGGGTIKSRLEAEAESGQTH